MAKKERHLAAIMFTDIVGYSAMMQKDEEYASRMRERHREIFNRWHNQYRGKVMQYYGDGTLSIFSSTADAVECAVAMQQSLKRHPKVPIRIGIHIGDVTYSNEEIYGDGVNIASRIESICVPGGVFISGKAYDDIKNHPRLRAKKLGPYALKNIQPEVDIYGISNPGITVPDFEIKPILTPITNRVPIRRGNQEKIGRKKKWITVFLAFFFGVFGSHRFYLQQRKYGIIYLSLFFLGAFIIPSLDQLVAIPAILGLIDAISFMAMSKDNFDAKYNPEYVAMQEEEGRRQQAHLAKANDPKRLLNQQVKVYFKKAEAFYREYDFNNAIEQLLKAVEIKNDVPEAHFLLARCYSMNEDTINAMYHIEAAVAFNLKQPERIRTHDDLAYLRVQKDFEAFKANNFRIPRQEPLLDSEKLELRPFTENELLDELNRLQQQWEEGHLTDQEFQTRKNNLISRDK